MERFGGSRGMGDGSRSHYNIGYHGPGFFRWATISSIVGPFFFLKVGTTLMLGKKGPTKLLMVAHLKKPGPWYPML